MLSQSHTVEALVIIRKTNAKVKMEVQEAVTSGVFSGTLSAKTASMRLLAASVPQSAQMEWPILGSLAQRSLMHVA